MSDSAQHARFDSIYARDPSAILGFAVRRCADPGDAADIAAEVFLTLWRRLDDIPSDGERLWLFGVARRVLANHRRGQLRRSALAERLRADVRHSCPAAPDDRAAAVLAAMARLPDRDREVLALTVWDGLTPAEIATLEGVPAATVRSRLLRARARLRELLHSANRHRSRLPKMPAARSLTSARKYTARDQQTARFRFGPAPAGRRPGPRRRAG